MKTFDVVVIGAGPGGYVAAIRCAQLGLNTAIVEVEHLGGVCLNVGCIPTKALLHSAELVRNAQKNTELLGADAGLLQPNYSSAHLRSRSVADGRQRGVQLLLRKNGITHFVGRAMFTANDSITVGLQDGEVEVLAFGHAIVATGARPRTLAAVPHSRNVVTYREQIMQDSVPKEIAIVGAGSIGIEFATLFSTFGSKVVILEKEDQLLSREDPDASREVLRALKKSGVEVRTGVDIQSVNDTGLGVEMVVAGAAGRSSIYVDRVMVAIGFLPNVDGLGLEAAGVEYDAAVGIEVDEMMRTTTKNIYAIGDVTMKMPLAHVAEAHGRLAAEGIAGLEPKPLNYDLVPRVTFSEPQIASFGRSESEAVDSGEAVRIAKFPFMANGKAHAIGETAGFVKLVASAASDRIVGGSLVGPNVSELLPELTLACSLSLAVEDLAGNMHSHPSLGEAVQEAFNGLDKGMINF